VEDSFSSNIASHKNKIKFHTNFYEFVLPCQNICKNFCETGIMLQKFTKHAILLKAVKSGNSYLALQLLEKVKIDNSSSSYNLPAAYSSCFFASFVTS
jgi:hypothetical protein